MNGPPRFQVHHDLTGPEQQQRLSSLRLQGYRIISLSVYNTSDDPRYATVWARRSGPRWAAVQGVDLNGMIRAGADWARLRFKPTIITATGTADHPLFAAVFEATVGPIPVVRLALRSGSASDEGTLQYWIARARDLDLIPTTFAMYGSPNDPRYAIVLEPNVKKVGWCLGGSSRSDGAAADGPLGGTNQTAEEYQRQFDVLTRVGDRPAYVVVSPAGRYLALFRGDEITSWAARHNMTSAGFQAEYSTLAARGFHPILLQGGGIGNETRFAALFARKEPLVPRRFVKTGPNTSARVDDVIEDFMVANGVRQAALSVVSGRRLVYARGFTWAEPRRPVTEPTTVFRVASCSKVLTSIAIHQLLEEGGSEARLHLGDRVQDILRLQTPTGGPPVDARFGSVTIENLLRMEGWMRRPEEEEVAAQFNQDVPVTDEQVARYFVGQTLRFDPGTLRYPLDGNPEYLLLGLVAKRFRGQGTLLDVIQTHIATPLGLNRVRLGVTPLAQQSSDEARYDDFYCGVVRSDVESGRPLAPEQYGEFDPGAWAAAGGFAISAVDFAKILASLNTDILLSASSRANMLQDHLGWDGSGGPANLYKGGYLSGLQSMVNFTEGGNSYVIYWNRDHLPEGWYPNFEALAQAIQSTTWPAGDLFPTFGIPSLP